MGNVYANNQIQLPRPRTGGEEFAVRTQRVGEGIDPKRTGYRRRNEPGDEWLAAKSWYEVFVSNREDSGLA